MATTPMRTPKSAVSEATDLTIVPQLCSYSSYFPAVFYPLREVPVSSYQSFPLPKRPRVSASVEEVRRRR